MKIKILEVLGYPDDYDYNETIFHKEDCTDWEEVSEDELDALYLWVKEENSKSYDKKIVIIKEISLDYKKTIALYLQKAKDIREELAAKEQKKKEAEAKRLFAAQKSELRKREKTKEKKLEKLEKLKKELGVE